MVSLTEAEQFYRLPGVATTSQAGLIPYPNESGVLDNRATYNASNRQLPYQPRTSAERSPPGSGPFVPDPTWGLLQPDISLKEALNSQPSSLPSRTNTDLLRRTHRTSPIYIVASILPTLGAVAQLLLLLYLLDTYISLPLTPTGYRPRISPFYSIWPYIACVGSLRLKAYRIFGFLIATFTISTFVADIILHASLSTSKWLRYLRLAAATIGSGALISVVFAAADDTSHLHLYLVSVQGVGLATIKGLTWMIDHQLNRVYSPRHQRDHHLRTAPHALLLHRWRFIVYLLSTPIGILTVIGIYACRDVKEVQTPGTMCYVLVAIAAICDWLYQSINVVFLLSLAFELYVCERWELPGEGGAPGNMIMPGGAAAAAAVKNGHSSMTSENSEYTRNGRDLAQEVQEESNSRRAQVNRNTFMAGRGKGKHVSRESESRTPLFGYQQV